MYLGMFDAFRRRPSAKKELAAVGWGGSTNCQDTQPLIEVVYAKGVTDSLRETTRWGPESATGWLHDQ